MDNDKPVTTTPRFEAHDAITSRLGLERIEGFSLATFFSGVFQSRGADHVEDHLSVGFKATTPALSPAMAAMPTPWLFGRCLFLTLLLFVPLYLAFEQSENLLLLPGLVTLGSFAVPISTLVLFFELNTPRNVSVTRLAWLFLMGATTSLLVSTVLYENTPFLGILGAPAAGLVEEAAKLLALALVTRRFDLARYPYILNGLLFGAAVGAGFAAFETSGYAMFMSGRDASITDILLLRGVMAPFGHIIWSAMIGAVFWRARVSGLPFGEIVRDRGFLTVFLAAVALHTLWNLGLPVSPYILAAVLGFVGWVIVLSLVGTGLREVGHLAASVEAP